MQEKYLNNNNSRQLDLTGLKYIVIGMVSLICLAILTALFKGHFISALLIILELAAAALFVVGMIKMRQYSQHFGNALKMMITLIFGLIIMFAIELACIKSMHIGLGFWMMTSAFGMIYVSVMFLSYREIAYGLAEIVKGEGDTVLERQCLQLWSLWKIAMVVFLVIIPAVCIAAYRATVSFSSAAGNALTFLGVLTAGVYIFLCFIVILFIMRALTIYKKYHNRLMGAPLKPVDTTKDDKAGRMAGREEQQMNYCQMCGQPLRIENRYCENCGTKIPGR